MAAWPTLGSLLWSLRIGLRSCWGSRCLLHSSVSDERQLLAWGLMPGDRLMHSKELAVNEILITASREAGTV